MIFDLSGHVTVVTGGNRGIGLGMARGLAKAGASIAVWGRDRERNAAAAKELEAVGADAAPVECDVASESSVKAATAATLDRFERIDSCFANAGVNQPQRPFLEMSVDDWNHVLGINLTGAFLTFREIARHMVERGGGGKLVVTSSMGARFGIPRAEHYAASKAAVCSLVRSLAVELGRHDIQANAILPGWIETEMTDGVQSQAKWNESILKRTPARRWGTPEDFEAIAVYFASKASKFHNADTVLLDGGYSVL